MKSTFILFISLPLFLFGKERLEDAKLSTEVQKKKYERVSPESCGQLQTRRLLKPINESFSREGKLLELDTLFNLKEYHAQYNNVTRKLVVYDPNSGVRVADFSKVEAMVIETQDDILDTLLIDNDLFPNLKALKIKGVFYDELVNVSKIHTLQLLSISSLSRGDFNLDSYKLFFPVEFWDLKNLQALEISADHLSDISENIRLLENLQILQIHNHERSPQLVIPWTMLLLDKLKILGVSNLSQYNYEDLELFSSVAHFKVVPNAFSSKILKSINAPKKSHNFQNYSQYVLNENRLTLSNDSLTLIIELNATRTSFHGKAQLVKKDSEVIQERYYLESNPDGQWVLTNNAGTQKRLYDKGNPKGKWTYKSSTNEQTNQCIKVSHNGSKVRGSWRLRCKKRMRYDNFNHSNYFETLKHQ